MKTRRLCIKAGALALLGSALSLSAAIVAPTDSQAASFESRGKALKTQPLESGRLEAFYKAVAELEKAPRGERATRLAAVRSLASGIKTDAAQLAGKLKANGEIEAFDQMVLDKAKASGGSAATELAAAGGAYALLSQASSHVDKTLARLAEEEGKLSAGPAGDEVVPHGKVLETLCGAFWFTISLGYGTQHAYTSCYS